MTILQKEGRISILKLSLQVGLSQPSVQHRVKQLEKKGYIKKYVALINAGKLGFEGFCFISVCLDRHQPERLNRFKESVRSMPEVLECHHITGEFDFLLKVLFTDRSALSEFIYGKLSFIPGVEKVSSSLILNDVKYSTRIPIE